jgi:4-carboxymuconolactone decarboxylase
MSTTRPSLNLRGKRFKPLDWDSMNPAQTRMVESVMTGKRGSMQGPYNVLLRSPELGDLAQKFGAHTRFNSSLPLALNELAILVVARAWTSQFVWWAHRAIAIEAGLDRDLVDDIAAGRSPQGLEKLPSEVAAVYSFCNELQINRKVSDATFAGLVKHYGEAGVVDLMGTMSYYTLVSMALNVDQYPLPEGVVAELRPLTFSS